jgi:hypothetical protein
MAFAEVTLTTSYALISSDATFTAQNISSGVAELLYSDTTPSVGDKGLLVPSYRGVDDTMGTGNLYGRAIDPTDTVVIVVST